MAKLQHTPGPWKYDRGFILAPNRNGIDRDVYIADIAREDEEGRVVSGEEQSANGSLLAAAPDMLAMLRQALEALNTAPRFKVGSTDSYAVARWIESVINQATTQE